MERDLKTVKRLPTKFKPASITHKKMWNIKVQLVKLVRVKQKNAKSAAALDAFHILSDRIEEPGARPFFLISLNFVYRELAASNHRWLVSDGNQYWSVASFMTPRDLMRVGGRGLIVSDTADNVNVEEHLAIQEAIKAYTKEP